MNSPLELIVQGVDNYRSLYNDALNDGIKAGLSQEFIDIYWSYKQQHYKELFGTVMVKNMAIHGGPAFKFGNNVREKGSWINNEVRDFTRRYRADPRVLHITERLVLEGYFDY